MTNLGDCDWLFKIPILILKIKMYIHILFPLGLSIKIQITIDTRTPVQFISIQFVQYEQG